MLTLFAIIVLGSCLGRFSVRGFGLKGAGVLLVAMVFGHYGKTIPQAISDYGLVLFVYAVGLQGGARFFRYIRREPGKLVLLAMLPVGLAAVVTLGIKHLFEIPTPLLLGLFSGGLTNTPSLAASVDALGGPASADGKLLSVGYGVAYPFGMFGVALFLQLLPKIFRRNLRDDAATLSQSAASDLSSRHFKVTNPNCVGKSLDELSTRRFYGANISRVTRAGKNLAAEPDLRLQQGDILTAVASEESLRALRLVIGEEVNDEIELGGDVVALDLEVSLPELTEKTLKRIDFVERYGVLITRVRRQGIEFAPSGTTILEYADTIRVVGKREAAEALGKILGAERNRVDETEMLPFLCGILGGLLLGSIPFSAGSFTNIQLGASGGCFIVGLALGHYGRIGRLKLYVPQAARNLCRELGILLFLAGAGVNAGSMFMSTMSGVGSHILLFGAAITLVEVISSFALAYFVLKNTLLESAGLVCGVANNSLPLDYLKEESRSDFAALAYATVYPVSLIFKIIVAQLLLRVV